MTDTEAVMNLLRKVPLFANLKDEDKVCIEETEEWRLPAGEMLVEEGKHAEVFLCAPGRRNQRVEKTRRPKKSSSLAADPVRFSAKSRCYLARLT